MTVISTGISWTDSTWNPTTGCTKVSDGCKFCYAESLYNRLNGRGAFDKVTEHPDRLGQAIKFTPIIEKGKPRARLVFVNSMSDLMHDAVSDAFRDRVFDVFDRMEETVFQVLTKRPMTMRRYIETRYKARGVPRNLWLGVSVEDSRVRMRLDLLRRLKDAVGPFTAFASVEPLIGEVTKCDFAGLDWIIVGGESDGSTNARSRGRARPMEPAWALDALERGQRAGAAIYGKQWGTWLNNPLYVADKNKTHIQCVEAAIKRGEKAAWIGTHPTKGHPMVVGEKGGATFAGKLYRQMPAIYVEINAAVRDEKRLI
jgi:protein gp37